MSKDKLIELCKYLEGTCESLYAALDRFHIKEEDLTTEDYEIIDEHVFLCEDCNWWGNTSDAYGTQELICEDCQIARESEKLE